MNNNDFKISTLREFDLSLVDDDIASAYRKLGVMNYTAERPLLAQLCRHLRHSVCGRNISEPKVSATDASKCQRSGGDNDI